MGSIVETGSLSRRSLHLCVSAFKDCTDTAGDGTFARRRMTSQFPRIFLWHVVRNVRRHALLAALTVLSVGLGIAVYLAIQIANHSAVRSFAAGVDLVAGKSHLEVRGD